MGGRVGGKGLTPEICMGVGEGVELTPEISMGKDVNLFMCMRG